VSRVIFMCGPAGAGKSTYARRLESQGMVRLSFDVELWGRGISTVPLPPEVGEEIEEGLRARLLELVSAGTDVVLDFSFWSRRMRGDYRTLLEPTGVVPETVYLATDRDTVLNRMRARRGNHPDDYVLTEELVIEHFDHFEPPTLTRARSRSSASASPSNTGQQIRGSGSPTSMSTIRVPPKPVFSSTSPGGSSWTRPMIAAPAPSG
jgi:predicted kinase